MTELAQPARVIEPDAPQYNAALVRREDQHESLAYFWVRMDADATPFLAGQYMTIGVMVDGRIVQRPYSIASAPSSANDGYEMYVRLVENGAKDRLDTTRPARPAVVSRVVRSRHGRDERHRVLA